MPPKTSLIKKRLNSNSADNSNKCKEDHAKFVSQKSYISFKMTVKKAQLIDPQEKEFLITEEPGNLSWGRAHFGGITENSVAQKSQTGNIESVKLTKSDFDLAVKTEAGLLNRITKELGHGKLVFQDETDSEASR